MKTITFFKIAAAAAFGLGFALPALAQHAQVPVLSTNFVKPNVMIMLDTSGSMVWDINGKSSGQSGFLGTNRITIAKKVLTGEGMVAYQTQGVNVYLGQTGGTNNYNLRNQYVTFTTRLPNITSNFTKIMLLNTSFKPNTTGPYFVFADNDDIMISSVGGANAPGYVSSSNPGYMTTATGKPNAFTTLDQFLWSQKSTGFGLEIVSHTDITDGGTFTSQLVKPRDVYHVVPTASGSVSPRTVFVQHFSDVYNILNNPACTISYTATPPTVNCTSAASNFEAQPTGTGTPLPLASGSSSALMVTRTSRVFPVVYLSTGTSSNYCYTSGSPAKYYGGCYKPIAAGSQASGSYFFVFMDQTDYAVPMNNANQKFWSVSQPLRDYLNSKGGLSYKWYAYSSSGTGTNVCGDSTGTCTSSSYSDGRTDNRVIFQWVATGTSGATVFVDDSARPTEAEVRTAMVGNIPQVQLTDVISPDGIYGPDFIFKTTYNARLDYAIRMGLGIPQPTLSSGSTSSDILNYLNTALTYTNSGVTYHFLDGDTTGGSFDGLTYDIAYYEKNPGLLDIYTNIRWGLADLDGLGGTYNENCNGTDSDFPGCGARIDDSLPDEYTAATSAATANTKVQADINAFSPNNSTPLANAMKDMYWYFLLAPALKTNLLLRADPPKTDTTPSMYVDQNCLASDGNEGHVVQDDTAYINGCRKNYLIFVTDGAQTSGEGCPSGDGSTECPKTNAITAQTKYVNLLRAGGDYTKGVKVFLIGFALNGDQNAIDELNAMALASKMDANDKYTTYFSANDETGLKSALSTIFNAIMEGSYTRSSPTMDAKETVEVDGYFTVVPNEPMWQGHLEVMT